MADPLRLPSGFFMDERNMSVSQEYLKSIIDYNPQTGMFIWLKETNKIRFGDRAGWIDKSTGYMRVQIGDRNYRLNRLAWLYMTGYLPTEFVDHKNCDRTDNRFSNLRLATKSQNAWNSKTPKNNTSGVKGVSWHKRIKKWAVCIGYKGKNRHIGFFESIDEARSAAMRAREKMHMEFCNHD